MQSTKPTTAGSPSSAADEQHEDALVPDQADDAVADPLPAAADDHDLAEQLHASKPWYFANGKRYPMEARRNQKLGGRRLAKLMPEEDRWSDRITNQLMYVPPDYEEYRASGQMKTILLYNGMGPWGKVNEGK